ncbi:tetratricopeptide repeat protein [bacterium]|nr:tetratricopeptide repeat protein [bacterium]
MTKRRTNSKARSTGNQPTNGKASGSSGSLLWIIGLVLLLGGVFVFLNSGGKDKGSAKAEASTVAATNKIVAKAPPAPAPAAPEIKPAAAQTNLANTQPPAAQIDTNSLSDMLSLGNYLLKQDQLTDAENAYRRAVEINPDDEDAHFNLGLALARQKKYEDAAKEYNEALKIYPDYVEVKNNLANTLIELGRTNDAIAQLEEAIQLNPDYVQGLNNLGRLRAVEGEFDKAEKLLKHAAELDPKNFGVQFNLGSFYLQKHDAPAAVTSFESAHKLQPDNLLALNLLAKSLTIAGKPEQALSYLTNSLATHPDSPELLFNTGLLKLGMGHPAEAVAMLQQVIKLAPSFTPAQEALKQAEEAAAKSATPPDLKSGK